MLQILKKKKGRKEGINRRKKEDPLFPRIRERKRKKTGFVSIFHGHSIQGREILVSRISRDLAVDRVETLDARTYKRANNEKRG